MKKVGIKIINMDDYCSLSISNDKTKIICYHMNDNNYEEEYEILNLLTIYNLNNGKILYRK